MIREVYPMPDVQSEQMKEDCKNCEQNFGDLLYLDCPDPKSVPRMSLYDRAAQFSPFAALTGYGSQILQTEEKFTEENADGLQRTAFFEDGENGEI
ncbi:MAG: hypothetical protein K6E18_03860 [Lachnospiraceae bacterium]|nr:hypothetical protein [Lachnospiraceae bacterium]